MKTPVSAPTADTELVLGQNEPSFEALSRFVVAHPQLFNVRTPFGGDQYVLREPDDVRHVLVTGNKRYVKGRTFRNMKMLMGEGLIVQDGEVWLERRRSMQPMFRETVLADVSRTVERQTECLLKSWVLSARSGEEINVTHDTAKNVLHTLLEVLFSEDLERLKDSDGRYVFDILVDDSARNINLVPRFRALLRHVDELVERRSREQRLPPDFLSMLMTMRDSQGAVLPLEQVRDQVATLIIAGHETTASLLNWTWLMLSLNPLSEQRLHEALRSDDPDASRTSIRCVLLETLRLFPAVWLEDRIAVADDEIRGTLVSKGSEVFIPIYFIQRDARYFPEPNTFIPQRFEATSLDPRLLRAPHPTTFREDEPGSRSAFFPFSAGPRRCIGDRFSMMNAEIHVAMVARAVSLRARDGVSVELDPRVNLRSKSDLMFLPLLRE